MKPNMWDREPKENWKISGRKLEENQTKPNKWHREPKENWKKSGRQLEEKSNKTQTKQDKGSEDWSSAVLMGWVGPWRRERKRGQIKVTNLLEY